MKAILISILIASSFQSNAAELFLGLTNGANKSFSTSTWTGNFLMQGNFGFTTTLFFGQESHKNFVSVSYTHLYCKYRLTDDNLLFIIDSGNAFDIMRVDFGLTFFTKVNKKYSRFLTGAIGFNRWLTTENSWRSTISGNGIGYRVDWRHVFGDFEMKPKYGLDLNFCYGFKFRTKKGGYWRTGLSLILNFVELPKLGVIWSVNSGPKQNNVYNHFPIQLNYSISRRIFKTKKEF